MGAYAEEYARSIADREAFWAEQAAAIGQQHLAVNLTQREDCRRLVDHALTQHGRVDILVNVAGIQTVSPIQEFPVEKFEFIMRVMLHAPWYLIRQSVPHMYAKGWGRIVNLSSAHGLRASEYKSAYVTAKHGLEGLSKVVALEGAPHGVTSVTVNPAYVRTPLVEKQIADQARTHGISEDEVIEKIMLTRSHVKRLIEPEEVAELVLFLTGPASASMSGTSYPIDGAWTAY